MKNSKGQFVCGVDITPPDKRTMRPRRDVWFRPYCKRVVKAEGDQCWQHAVPDVDDEARREFESRLP